MKVIILLGLLAVATALDNQDWEAWKSVSYCMVEYYCNHSMSMCFGEWAIVLFSKVMHPHASLRLSL
jgi:hypothetical protein